MYMKFTILLCKAFFLQKIERFFIFSENCIDNLNMNTIDNNSIMEERQEYITMEELHSETISGMIMLSSSLNPLAEEWESTSNERSYYHLRGKNRIRVMRKNYFMKKGKCPCPPSRCFPWGRDTTCCTICYVTSDGIDISDSITFSYIKKKEEFYCKQSVNDYLKSKMYKDKLEAIARVLAFESIKKPDWSLVETKMLKAVFALIIKENNEMKIMVRPLNKWNRNQMIQAIDKLWKPGNKSFDVEMCMICHEDMVEDTPTIQLLCKHKLCTNCFLNGCEHEHGVMEKCPICREYIMDL